MVNTLKYTLTLISGDCLSFDKKAKILDIHAAKYRNYPVSFKQVDTQDGTYIFPEDFTPYIPGTFDKELFNISKMTTNGYIDDKLSYIPLLILCSNSESLRRVERVLENIVDHKQRLISINGLSAHVPKIKAPLFIKALFNSKDNSLEKTTLLQTDVKQIRSDRVVSI